MDQKIHDFVRDNGTAVMTTLKKDGTPHVAVVLAGWVDGELWSSGTQDRVRTGHLRRDPRATLCFLDGDNRYRWLGLETTVEVLDDDGPGRNLMLYRALAGEPDDVEEYLRAMEDEKRLVYRFTILRSYGPY